MAYFKGTGSGTIKGGLLTCLVDRKILLTVSLSLSRRNFGQHLAQTKVIVVLSWLFLLRASSVVSRNTEINFHLHYLSLGASPAMDLFKYPRPPAPLDASQVTISSCLTSIHETSWLSQKTS